MKKISFLFIVYILLISCFKTNTTSSLADVSTFEKLKNQEDIQLVDVRTPEEYNQAHLKNATNININDTDFEVKLSELDKNKPLLLYCRSGARSARATSIAKELGFTQVTDLDGGITSWLQAGKEVETE